MSLSTDSDDSELTSSSHLYITASIFNHSCAPNALWTILGDVIIVRARVDVEEGQEVFIPYTGAISDKAINETVERSLSKHFPNAPGCQCSACEATRRDGRVRVARRRDLMANEYERIKEDLRNLATSQSSVPITIIRRGKQLIADLGATYSPSRRCNIRVSLAQAEHWLSEAFHLRQQYEEAIKHSFKSFQAQGGEIEPSPLGGSSTTPRVLAAPLAPGSTGINTLLVNASRCLYLGRPDTAMMWLRLAMETAEMVNGGGRKLFERKFRGVMETVGVMELFLRME